MVLQERNFPVDLGEHALPHQIEGAHAKYNGLYELAYGPEGQELEDNKKHLADLLAYHKKKNSLLSVLTYFNGELSEIDEGEVTLPLVFKLAEPGIKFMNDKLFGMEDTDKFLDFLRALILTHCTKNANGDRFAPEEGYSRRMQELVLNFKGGMALFDGDLHAPGENGGMSFASRIVAFNLYLKLLFQTYLLDCLEKEIENGGQNESRIKALAESAHHFGAEAYEITEALGGHEFDFDYAAYDGGDTRLNFGIGEWPELMNGQVRNLKDVVMAIMHAELNANMLRRRQEENSTGNVRMSELQEKYARLDVLMNFFYKMRLKGEHADCDVIFDENVGLPPLYLDPDLNLGGLARIAGKFRIDSLSELKELFALQEELLQAGGSSAPGVTERKKLNEDSFARTISFQLMDFLAVFEELRAEVSQLSEDAPERLMFVERADQFGSSVLRRTAIDAIRKSKLDVICPGGSEGIKRLAKKAYKVVNVPDILKDFLGENIDGYIAFQELLYGKVKRAEKLLSKELLSDAEKEEIAQLRQCLLDYAMVSPKDPDLHVMEGNLEALKEDSVRCVSSSTRLAFVKALVGRDKKVKKDKAELHLDVGGFGAINYEALFVTNFDMLKKTFAGVSTNVLVAIRACRTAEGKLDVKQAAELLEKELSSRPDLLRELWGDLLSTAKEANEMLARFGRDLAAVDGVEIVEREGGDEYNLIVDLNDLDWGELIDVLERGNFRMSAFLDSAGKDLDEVALHPLAREVLFESLKEEGSLGYEKTSDGQIKIKVCKVNSAPVA